jgi:hypothetical protein
MSGLLKLPSSCSIPNKLELLILKPRNVNISATLCLLNMLLLGVLLLWVMRWTLPFTASMRQNSSFNPTIYIGSIQDEA